MQIKWENDETEFYKYLTIVSISATKHIILSCYHAFMYAQCMLVHNAALHLRIHSFVNKLNCDIDNYATLKIHKFTTSIWQKEENNYFYVLEIMQRNEVNLMKENEREYGR